jgi:hypothetical protein
VQRLGREFHCSPKCQQKLASIPLKRFVTFMLPRFYRRQFGLLARGAGVFKNFCLVTVAATCLALAGCASTGPAAPSLAAMPPPGKPYEAFQRDDFYCQTAAQQAIGYQSPGQAANDAAVGTAAVGTGLGALAGAALGSLSGHAGAGAVVGAATGLATGSAVGAGNARAAGGSLQGRYDTVYAQCMTSKGNRIAAPAYAEPVYFYPRPYNWGPGYY